MSELVPMGRSCHLCLMGWLCVATLVVSLVASPAVDITHHIKYHPASMKPRWSETGAKRGIREWVVMTKRSGERYNCSLPETEEKPDADEGDAEDEEAEVEVDPTTILAPLVSTCLFRVEGWWTYEFCYQKHLRQFHVEGKTVTAEFSLGTQSTQTPVSVVENTDQLPFKSGGGKVLETHLSEGTECDLTKRPRISVVYFTCDPASKHTVFTSIQETATCEYTVVVTTPLLCDDNNDDSKPKNDFEINCYAVLDSDREQKSETCSTEVPAGGAVGSQEWDRAVRLDDKNGELDLEEAKFRIGQCFRHKSLSYRAVVVASDPVCLQTDGWVARMGVDKLKYGRNQPFYHAFVDERDRKGGQVTYVAQENVMIEKMEEPIQHPLVKDLFAGFSDGHHIARPDVAISLMPAEQEDLANVVEDLLQQLSPAADEKKGNEEQDDDA